MSRAALAPSFLIDAARSLTAVWLLRECLGADDVVRLPSLLRRLARRLGVPVRFPLQPATETWPLVGTLAVGIIPQRGVTIEDWNPSRRYPLADLVAWLEGGD
jgi:hypothetical protein